MAFATQKQETRIGHGDFTGLAQNYSLYRPGYSESVLRALLGLLSKPTSDIDCVDVGAGTGIWSRMLHKAGVRSVTAVEPNDDMRRFGEKDSGELGIVWKKGDGAHTGLTEQSADMVGMASSFHWVNFEDGTKEFHRILRKGGRFVALWNPRLIEANPLLVEIEAYLNELRGDIKRVSSGRSGITDTLTTQLEASPYFEDVIYLEGRHSMSQTPEHYLGVWRSVNDLRHQLGEEIFEQFMRFVERKIAGKDRVEVTYLTRAWSARCR